MRGGSVEYCPNCFNVKHSLGSVVVGLFAWLFWRALPDRLAFSRFGYTILPYAGDWIWDTRGCGCRVPLVRDR